MNTHLTLVVLGVFSSTSALAASAEELAKVAASEIARTAPMPVDQATTLVGAYALGTTVVAIAEIQPKIMGTTQQQLVGRKYQFARESKTITATGLCARPDVAAFFRIGGSYEYRYRFPDGSPFFSYAVGAADCPKRSEIQRSLADEHSKGVEIPPNPDAVVVPNPPLAAVAITSCDLIVAVYVTMPGGELIRFDHSSGVSSWPIVLLAAESAKRSERIEVGCGEVRTGPLRKP